jgi:P pilus assembly chaperone PapD
MFPCHEPGTRFDHSTLRYKRPVPAFPAFDKPAIKHKRQYTMRKTVKACWVILRSAGLVCLSLVWPLHEALADVMLHPTRIVFEKNVRAAQVDLINRGTDTVTYRISVVNRRMNELGQFGDVDVPQPGELFADPMLRYSPRQVTLAPGAAQVIRILLRKPPDLPAGEYRSHLLFQSVAETEKPAAGTAGEPGQQLDIQMKALISVSVPVIVRHGELQATAAVGELSLKNGAAGEPDSLAFELRRTGNRSLFGDIVVTYLSPGGPEVVVGRANGVAVYAPNAVRRGSLVLQPPPGVDLARGPLNVAYRARPEDGGRVIAERRLQPP